MQFVKSLIKSDLPGAIHTTQALAPHVAACNLAFYPSPHQISGLYRSLWLEMVVIEMHISPKSSPNVSPQSSPESSP